MNRIDLEQLNKPQLIVLVQQQIDMMQEQLTDPLQRQNGTAKLVSKTTLM